MSYYDWNENEHKTNQRDGNQIERKQVYGHMAPYDDSFNRDPKPPKKKTRGLAGVIIAVAMAGAVAGSALMGFVIMPLVGAVNYTQQKPIASVQNDGAVDEMPALEETPNKESKNTTHNESPVVAVGEQLRESVVGVAMYETQFVPGQQAQEQAISSGTGFIYSKDGYVITNSHVVSQGNSVKITMSDGTEYPARLIGKDVVSDIAVLKIDAPEASFKPVKIGDSTQSKAGELVVAIGNPLGQKLSNTLTVGYLSAVSREVMLNDVKTEMLQTDAAINPGNSGGPLVNVEGEVIGITTLKSIIAGIDAYGNQIPSEGIGFAIPISNAVPIVDQLISTNGASGSLAPNRESTDPRPGIGIGYSMISEADAQNWGTPRGALVGTVVQGGPAQKAGIQANDIITQMDGVDLTQGQDLPTFEGKNIGDTITAVVWRGGQEYDVQMTLEDINQYN